MMWVDDRSWDNRTISSRISVSAYHQVNHGTDIVQLTPPDVIGAFYLHRMKAPLIRKYNLINVQERGTDAKVQKQSMNVITIHTRANRLNIRYCEPIALSSTDEEIH
jgi:hypothetical protein